MVTGYSLGEVTLLMVHKRIWILYIPIRGIDCGIRSRGSLKEDGEKSCFTLFQYWHAEGLPWSYTSMTSRKNNYTYTFKV